MAAAATPKPQGGLPTSVTKAKPLYGEATDADDAVETAMQRVMDAYAKRQERDYDPGLMAIAQGLLSSTGNFGSAAGAAAKNYQDVQAQLKQEEIDTATAELQLSQATRDQALMRKKMEAASGLFGEPSGRGAADEGVDQDAVSLLTQSGIPRKEAVGFLIQGGISPAQKVNGSGFDLSSGLKKYAQYVTLYGNDDQAKAFLEALKLQNQRYSLQGGQVMETATGNVRYAAPEGLPPPGERNIDLLIGDGTRKVDQRTAILYEFANNQGPEVAKEFVAKYLKDGTVPKDIVDKYKAQQSGSKAPAGGAEISPEKLNSILTALELKSTAFGSPTLLVGEKAGEKTPLDKSIKFNPQEAQVMAAMFRIGNAQVDGKEEDLSPFDRQVLNAFRAKAKPPVAIAPPSDVEKEAAAKAAVVPVAAAAVAPAKAAAPAAAVVPTPVKVAETPAKAAAAPAAAVSSSAVTPVGVRPAPPKIISVPPLKANASLEDQKSQEALKANAEAANRAEIERYRIEMEQYNKQENRAPDTEQAIQKAAGEELARKAAAEEALIPDNLKAAKATLYGAGRIADKVMKSPQAFGFLEHPGYVYALLTLVDKGFKVGDASITLDGLKDALYKADPSISQDDLNNRATAIKDLAEMQLMYAKKDMKGQGAISDKERAIASALSGSPEDNYIVLYHRMKLLAERSQRDIDEANAFYRWRNDPQNKTKNYYDFQRTSVDLAGINAKYDKKMEELSNKWFKTTAATKAESSGAPAATVPPRFTKAQQAIIDALK
jgi:hypothetical protein